MYTNYNTSYMLEKESTKKKKIEFCHSIVETRGVHGSIRSPSETKTEI